jgi:hypothetical protein
MPHLQEEEEAHVVRDAPGGKKKHKNDEKSSGNEVNKYAKGSLKKKELWLKC